MKRNILIGMSTLSAVVALASYHTSTAGPTQQVLTAQVAATSDADGSGSSGSTGSTDTSAGDTSSGTGSSGSSSSGTTSGSGTTTGTTVTGDAVQTRYGPVQVQITVENGKIVAAQAVQYPNTDPHDAMINDQAVPMLNQEAVASQSANLDSISGATFTSEGYLTSLQSAIDKANL